MRQRSPYKNTPRPYISKSLQWFEPEPYEGKEEKRSNLEESEWDEGEALATEDRRRSFRK